jgi:hypothetical protein
MVFILKCIPRPVEGFFPLCDVPRRERKMEENGIFYILYFSAPIIVYKLNLYPVIATAVACEPRSIDAATEKCGWEHYSGREMYNIHREIYLDFF